MLYGRNWFLVETALSIHFSFVWILFTANDICEHCVWSYFFSVSKHSEAELCSFRWEKKEVRVFFFLHWFVECNVCRISSAQLVSVAYHSSIEKERNGCHHWAMATKSRKKREEHIIEWEWNGMNKLAKLCGFRFSLLFLHPFGVAFTVSTMHFFS